MSSDRIPSYTKEKLRSLLRVLVESLDEHMDVLGKDEINPEDVLIEPYNNPYTGDQLSCDNLKISTLQLAKEIQEELKLTPSAMRHQTSHRFAIRHQLHGSFLAKNTNLLFPSQITLENHFTNDLFNVQFFRTYEKAIQRMEEINYNDKCKHLQNLCVSSFSVSAGITQLEVKPEEEE